MPIVDLRCTERTAIDVSPPEEATGLRYGSTGNLQYSKQGTGSSAKMTGRIGGCRIVGERRPVEMARQLRHGLACSTAFMSFSPNLFIPGRWPLHFIGPALPSRPYAAPRRVGVPKAKKRSHSCQ